MEWRELYYLPSNGVSGRPIVSVEHRTESVFKDKRADLPLDITWLVTDGYIAAHVCRPSEASHATDGATDAP